MKKKIVSLLLAGVMGLSMAATASAAWHDLDKDYVYGTIMNGTNGSYAYYPWYYQQNGNLLYPTEEGDYVSLNDYLYWQYIQKYWEDVKDAANDTGMTMTPEKEVMGQFTADMAVEYGTAACPTEGCKNTSCKAYLIRKDNAYSFVVGCPTHSYQAISNSSTVLPGVTTPDATTYTFSGYSSIGGEVFFNADVTSNSASVKPGSTVYVSIVPDYGYEISAVYVNGYYYGTDSSFVLTANRNYTVSARFSKINVSIPYTVKAAATGNGKVYAIVNGNSVGTMESLVATYADTVTLRFVPGEGNYKVGNVVVNGVNKGSITTLDIGRLRGNVDISANFVWDNPYDDVKTHLAAVEYVTEANIMGSPYVNMNTDVFEGTAKVNIKGLACYLAEQADVSDKLNKVQDRVDWALEKGLIAKDETLTDKVTWTRACDMLNAFVRLLEKERDITFTDLVGKKTAFEVAEEMDLVTDITYKNNAVLTRYDVAELCYAVVQLEVK